MNELGEIEKIASSGAADKLMELVLKGFGPSVEKFGLIGGDLVGEIRWKNLRRIQARMRKKLEQGERKPKTIPPRVLVPILESASVEDDKTLQEMWAGLLATASQETDKLSPSFAETLKQLTPDEARFFDKLYRRRTEKTRGTRFFHSSINPIGFRAEAPHGVSAETFERLGLIRRVYGLTRGDSADEKEVGYLLEMTEYAQKFMRACWAQFHIESEVAEREFSTRDLAKEIDALKNAIDKSKAQKR